MPSWANNCAATDATNGVDFKGASFSPPPRRLPRADIIDKGESSAVGLPHEFEPTLPPVNGSTGVIKSFILPDSKTGVVRVCICSPTRAKVLTYQEQMFVGSFGGDFDGFQHDVVAAVTQFKAAGVTHLLIDLTNNGGMGTCTFVNCHYAQTMFRRICLLGTISAPIFGWLQNWLSVRHLCNDLWSQSLIKATEALCLQPEATLWPRRSLLGISHSVSMTTLHSTQLITVSEALCFLSAVIGDRRLIKTIRGVFERHADAR